MSHRNSYASWDDEPGNGKAFTSTVELLRINYADENGASFPVKKLISRVSIYTIYSGGAWVSQASAKGDTKKRKIICSDLDDVEEHNIQVDSGFERNAALRIWSDGSSALTVLAVIPHVTSGG